MILKTASRLSLQSADAVLPGSLLTPSLLSLCHRDCTLFHSHLFQRGVHTRANKYPRWPCRSLLWLELTKHWLRLSLLYVVGNRGTPRTFFWGGGGTFLRGDILPVTSGFELQFLLKSWSPWVFSSLCSTLTYTWLLTSRFPWFLIQGIFRCTRLYWMFGGNGRQLAVPSSQHKSPRIEFRRSFPHVSLSHSIPENVIASHPRQPLQNLAQPHHTPVLSPLQIQFHFLCSVVSSCSPFLSSVPVVVCVRGSLLSHSTKRPWSLYRCRGTGRDFAVSACFSLLRPISSPPLSFWTWERSQEKTYFFPMIWSLTFPLDGRNWL